jgi:D-aminopeptidase
MAPGQWNAITDVPGVMAGHKTIIRGDDIRTGVTAVIPHDGNCFQEKSPAAIAVGNGFGKLTGLAQVHETGAIETPVILTNTLSVGTAAAALVRYILGLPGNEDVQSVNPVVGEINDGYLNDIRGMHVTEADLFDSIRSGNFGPVAEGNVGGGTGARAFGFKAGIGTASRIVPGEDDRRYTIGVLVQSNFGGNLDILGAPVGRELSLPPHADRRRPEAGSCMMVVATDAPLCSRNLQRLGARALAGLARTGSFMSNGSGDFVIAFSTAYRIPHGRKTPYPVPPLLPNDAMTALFRAMIEAAQEAIYNSVLTAATMTGYQGHTVSAVVPADVIRICRKYGVINRGDEAGNAG